MSQEKVNKYKADNELHEQNPEYDSSFNGEYRSPILMRIMLVIINLAALFFSRSLIQSWYSLHGTTPIWIPFVFLIVPLGSLFFIYFYMGRIGNEIIIKLICIAFCGAQIFNIFSPIDSMRVSLGKNGFSSDFKYVTEAGSVIGLTFPSGGSSTTVDDTGITNENKNPITVIKSLINNEHLYLCTDVLYKADQVTEFESVISKDPIWLTEIPDKIENLKCSQVGTDEYDFFLFYDCESKKLNTSPESGKHTIYQVMYNSHNHELRILKYSKKF